MNTAGHSSAQKGPVQENSSPVTGTSRPRVSRWAYVLIVIGTLSLFDQLGFYTWSGAPLVMIVVGIALLTRQYSWGRTLAVVLSGTLLIGAGSWYFMHLAGSRAVSVQTISQPLTTARAEIQLATAVGRLDVGSTESGNLIEGTLELGRNDRLERTLSTRGDTQVVSLAARQIRPNVINFGMLNQDNGLWQIRLSPKVPLVLKIETGVGDSTLNLEGLKVTDLSFKVGVGQATVHLPATGIIAASINGGVGKVAVTIPRGMQARIRASSGLGAVKVLGDFQRSGDTYTSSGYAGASNLVDLQIEGGVGQITVQQAGR